MSRPLLTNWFPVATTTPKRVGWYDVTETFFFENITRKNTKRVWWNGIVWCTGARGRDKTLTLLYGFWRGKLAP